MAQYNVHEAKTNLSRLLDEMERGEDVVIARAGRPVARLVPLGRAGSARVPDTYAGRIWMADDFESPLPEETLREFEGE